MIGHCQGQLLLVFVEIFSCLVVIGLLLHVQETENFLVSDQRRAEIACAGIRDVSAQQSQVGIIHHIQLLASQRPTIIRTELPFCIVRIAPNLQSLDKPCLPIDQT